VARRLGISKPALLAMCERGEITYHRIGTEHRFYELDVAAYLETAKHPAKGSTGVAP
jgi:excisionase family DNA binding protein